MKRLRQRSLRDPAGRRRHRPEQRHSIRALRFDPPFKLTRSVVVGPIDILRGEARRLRSGGTRLLARCAVRPLLRRWRLASSLARRRHSRGLHSAEPLECDDPGAVVSYRVALLTADLDGRRVHEVQVSAHGGIGIRSAECSARGSCTSSRPAASPSRSRSTSSPCAARTARSAITPGWHSMKPWSFNAWGT